MHDGMPYGPIQGQGQGHEPLKVWIPSIFKTYLLRLFAIYNGSWQMTTNS